VENKHQSRNQIIEETLFCVDKSTNGQIREAYKQNSIELEKSYSDFQAKKKKNKTKWINTII
jgi:hypothetical protein